MVFFTTPAVVAAHLHSHSPRQTATGTIASATCTSSPVDFSTRPDAPLYTTLPTDTGATPRFTAAQRHYRALFQVIRHSLSTSTAAGLRVQRAHEVNSVADGVWIGWPRPCGSASACDVCSSPADAPRQVEMEYYYVDLGLLYDEATLATLHLDDRLGGGKCNEETEAHTAITAIGTAAAAKDSEESAKTEMTPWSHLLTVAWRRWTYGVVADLNAFTCGSGCRAYSSEAHLIAVVLRDEDFALYTSPRAMPPLPWLVPSGCAGEDGDGSSTTASTPDALFRVQGFPCNGVDGARWSELCSIHVAVTDTCYVNPNREEDDARGALHTGRRFPPWCVAPSRLLPGHAAAPSFAVRRDSTAASTCASSVGTSPDTARGDGVPFSPFQMGSDSQARVAWVAMVQSAWMLHSLFFQCWCVPGDFVYTMPTAVRDDVLGAVIRAALFPPSPAPLLPSTASGRGPCDDGDMRLIQRALLVQRLRRRRRCEWATAAAAGSAPLQESDQIEHGAAAAEAAAVEAGATHAQDGEASVETKALFQELPPPQSADTPDTYPWDWLSIRRQGWRPVLLPGHCSPAAGRTWQEQERALRALTATMDDIFVTQAVRQLALRSKRSDLGELLRTCEESYLTYGRLLSSFSSCVSSSPPPAAATCTTSGTTPHHLHHRYGDQRCPSRADRVFADGGTSAARRLYDAFGRDIPPPQRATLSFTSAPWLRVAVRSPAIATTSLREPTSAEAGDVDAGAHTSLLEGQKAHYPSAECAELADLAQLMWVKNVLFSPPSSLLVRKQKKKSSSSASSLQQHRLLQQQALFSDSTVWLPVREAVERWLHLPSSPSCAPQQPEGATTKNSMHIDWLFNAAATPREGGKAPQSVERERSEAEEEEGKESVVTVATATATEAANATEEETFQWAAQAQQAELATAVFLTVRAHTADTQRLLRDVSRLCPRLQMLASYDGDGQAGSSLPSAEPSCADLLDESAVGLHIVRDFWRKVAAEVNEQYHLHSPPSSFSAATQNDGGASNEEAEGSLDDDDDGEREEPQHVALSWLDALAMFVAAMGEGADTGVVTPREAGPTTTNAASLTEIDRDRRSRQHWLRCFLLTLSGARARLRGSESPTAVARSLVNAYVPQRRPTTLVYRRSIPACGVPPRRLHQPQSVSVEESLNCLMAVHRAAVAHKMYLDEAILAVHQCYRERWGRSLKRLHRQ